MAKGGGVRIVRNDIPNIISRFPGVCRDIVGKLSLDGVAIVKRNIQAQQLIDTGNYLNSWDVLPVEVTATSIKGGFGSGVEYGPYLEYGTIHMPARPHVAPAADELRADAEGAFRALESRL